MVRPVNGSTNEPVTNAGHCTELPAVVQKTGFKASIAFLWGRAGHECSVVRGTCEGYARHCNDPV